MRSIRSISVQITLADHTFAGYGVFGDFRCAGFEAKPGGPS